MLKFYYHPTPNSSKVALFLEETGLPFEIIPVDTLKGEQHASDFRKVNPNGKLPAIDDDGTLVFDSNAILLYLAEKTGKYLGDASDRGDLLSWLMFIASGLGPYSGQSVHFRHAAPEQLPYAQNRYLRETERHYSVLNERLKGRTFIVGDSLTIVDMAAWGWIDKAMATLGEGGLSAYPDVDRWFKSIDALPAAARARTVAKDIAFKTERDEEAARALFPSNYAAA